MFYSSQNKQRGGVMLLVIMVLAIASSYLMYSLDLFKRSAETISKDWKDFVAEEVAQSAFVVLESALERRLWNIPPDENCLKMEEFDVEGEFDNGAKYQVKARYYPQADIIEMTSIGSYMGEEVKYQKNLKISDVSDYLILSKKEEETRISSPRYSKTLPSSILARDRRIFFDGPISFYSITARPNHPTAPYKQPWRMENPGEINIILQAERMIFKQGLSYHNQTAPVPSSISHPDFYDEYKNKTGSSHLWQSGGGGAFLTRDFNTANNVNQRMRSSTYVDKNLIKKHFYPIALFDGTPPMRADTATDNGSYFSDPDRWLIFTYGYGPEGEAVFGARRNFTCYTSNFVSDPISCSSSQDFPNGFRSWREDSDLEGTLFTDDFEDVQSTTIGWDNMDSMKEDAQKCGLYIESSGGGLDGSFTDCELSDKNFLSNYLSGGSTSCQEIKQLDGESIASRLNNFQANVPEQDKDRVLRRVVYSEAPLEISQSSAQGLMSGLNNDARSLHTFWFVNESVNYLRPHQPDTSSPLDTAASQFRELYFNDSESSSKSPLRLVMLSPEQTVIHSPFHNPMSKSTLQSDFPKVGGKLKPKYGIQTDWKHQEDDGFKYGMRKVNIKNISVVDNGDRFGYDSPFFLKGLWSVIDSSAIQYVRNSCLLSPSTEMPVRSRTPAEPFEAGKTLKESLTDTGHAGNVIPPLTSRFYQQTGTPGSSPRISSVYRPHVFNVQFGQTDVRESIINFEGTRLGVYFDNDAPSGMRNLSQPRHTRAHNYNKESIDLSNRAFYWAPGSYYNEGTKSCSEDPVIRGTTSSTHTNSTFLNRATYVFLHQSPHESFRNLGSILSQGLPILKVRQNDD